MTDLSKLKETFSERLKIAMSEREMSIYDMSEKMLCSYTTFYRYVEGISLPTIVNLHRISEILNFSTDFLLGLEE